MTEPPSARRISLWPPALVYGFATAVAMWCVWFVGHLPALSLPPQVNVPALIVTMLVGMILAGRGVGARGGAAAGAAAGAVASLLNLLVLGAHLAKPPQADQQPLPGFEGFTPSAGLIAVGFVVFGTVIGMVGGLVGSRGVPARERSRREWLARFGIVAAVAVIPLLLIGGSVTSTASGMAVPGWPSSYGANMFLYPITLMSQPRVFLEHTHRLFGSLVGLTTLVMALWTVLLGSSLRTRRIVLLGMPLCGAISLGLLITKPFAHAVDAGFGVAILGTLAIAAIVGISARETDRFAKVWALACLALVLLQGYLGGERVNETNPVLAMVHGVAAQLFFAMMVALAAYVNPLYEVAGVNAGVARDRARKIMAGALLHTTILQLVLGAAHRHLGQIKGTMHALWAHAAFSLIVVVAALAIGFSLRAREPGDVSRLAGWVRGLGRGIVHVVGLQFLLGWAAFFLVLKHGPRGASPLHDQLETAKTIDPWSALVATVHQGNGALLLALATLAAVFTRQLWRSRTAGLDRVAGTT